MSTTQTGRDAEELVAELLRGRGHSIVSLNWRTRWCEIDIVSTKSKVVYFTEVKFRKSAAWGEGFDYITKKKLKQMEFAAEFWITAEKWKGEAQMLAASVNAADEIELVEV